MQRPSDRDIFHHLVLHYPATYSLHGSLAIILFDILRLSWLLGTPSIFFPPPSMRTSDILHDQFHDEATNAIREVLEEFTADWKITVGLEAVKKPSEKCISLNENYRTLGVTCRKGHFN